MDEQQHLEDDTNKAANSVESSPPSVPPTSSSSSSAAATVTAPPSTSSINDEPAIIYICSPNQSKQKQLESILEELNPSYSVLYYSADTKDDERKMSNSEENDVMAIGSIRFPTTRQAEKVYALLNGTSLPSSMPSTSSLSPTIIQLRYNSFSRHYHGDTTTLLVDNLPDTMSMSSIYDLLRQYGPIAKCRRICISEDDTDEVQSQSTPSLEKRVEVEFFQKEDANYAQTQLSRTSFDDHDLSITVIAGIPNRSKPIAQRDRLGTSNTAQTGTSPPNKSKRKDKNRLSQHLLQQDDKQVQQRQQHHLQVEIKPSMDLCNLYIKGLSLSMTSNELFNLFKPHGRIISARVMANEQGVSKGFGFVSFSQPIEAASALVHLHQHYSILFHEPKVPRSDHDIQQQYWSLAHSPLGGYFYSTTVSLPSPPATLDTIANPTITGMPPPPAPAPAAAAAAAASAASAANMPPPPPPPGTAMPYYLYSAPPPRPPPFGYPPTTPYYYHHHPPPPSHMYYAPYPYTAPPIPSTSPAIVQRGEMQQAVQQALTNDKQQQDMVDMLMNLDETEKQQCLTDIAYLKEKMDQLHG
ncbi:unnamed protein product [Absidia cylindrospora]